MPSRVRQISAVVLLTVFLFSAPRKAHADTLTSAVVAVIAGVVVVSAGITVAVVYAVRHKPSITGCAAGQAGDLTITDEHSGKLYALTGDRAQLTVGQKVKVVGNKASSSAGKQEFRVLRVEKNLGPCSATVAANP